MVLHIGNTRLTDQGFDEGGGGCCGGVAFGVDGAVATAGAGGCCWIAGADCGWA
jgi:hypothetical protein